MTHGRIGLVHFASLYMELAERMQANITAEERAATEKLFAAMGLYQLSTGASPLTSSIKAASQPPVQAESKARNPYYGMGIGEASMECIKFNRTEMHVADIWEKLKEAGVESAHDNPVHAVYDSLKRRAKRDRDVIRTSQGTWGLVTWYSEDQLAEFRGANRSQRTKEGMAVAVARGARVGQPTKLTDEVIAEFERQVAAGVRVADIAKSMGLAEATFRKAYPKARLKELRGDAPGTPETQIIRPNFRSGRQ